MIGVVTGNVITDQAGVTIDPVHVRDDHECGDGIAGAARSAASSEAVAEGIADTDEDGNGSDIVTALGTTAVAITIVITNRYGVIDDPVRVRDDHDRGDGTGDGRIDDAGGAEVEDEAVAAIDRTRSVEVVACRFGSGREEGSRRDDAALLSMIRFTRHRP